jgi:hypothetical protein
MFIVGKKEGMTMQNNISCKKKYLGGNLETIFSPNAYPISQREPSHWNFISLITDSRSLDFVCLTSDPSKTSNEITVRYHSSTTV